MRAVKLLLGLIAAVAVQLVAVSLHPEISKVFDPFLIVVVLGSLFGSGLVGLGVGLVVGLVQDSLAGGLYGLHGFADTITGYATARAGQRLVVERPAGVTLVIAVASLVQQLVLLALAALVLGDPPLPHPGLILVRAVITGLLGGLIYSFGGRLKSRRLQRRRGRLSRLRFGG